MVYNYYCCSQAISWRDRIRTNLVCDWMEIPDVITISKPVKLESFFDGLAWHHVCVMGLPRSFCYSFIQWNMCWRHVTLLYTYSKLLQNNTNMTVLYLPFCRCYLWEIWGEFMEVPFDLFKLCLAHIFSDSMGRILRIIPPVVFYCRWTRYFHVQHIP